MNIRVKSAFDAAEKLSDDEKHELVELILATCDVAPDVENAWASEVADRILAHEQGRLPARSATEVLAKYLKS